jgi:competence protein ComEA
MNTASPSDSRITATVPLPPLNDLKALPTREFSAVLAGSWPRSAQWTTAALLGGVLILLGMQMYKGGGERPAPDPELLLDVNRAARAELMQVPGVGPALADRLLAYRKVHGPFQNLEDLRRVPGVGPATWRRLRDHLCVEPPPPGTVVAVRDAHIKPPAPAKEKRTGQSKKEEALAGQVININRANLTDLQKLPGIGVKLSQRIVEERGKRPFADVNELRRVSGIGPKTLEKIRPFVVVSDAGEALASVR